MTPAAVFILVIAGGRCRVRRGLAVALASASKASGGDAKAIKAELKKFQGTWAGESIWAAGKEVGGPSAKNLRLTFAGNKVTSVDLNVMSREEATIKIDPAKKPAHIDITDKGKTRPAIYAFEGDGLKICIDVAGKVRPTGFSAPEGSTNILLVYKRVVKK
jgi:uncharacterized protein (TIGR03067 family)